MNDRGACGLGAELSGYLDDELSGSERLDVEAHLGRCPSCRRRLEALRAAGRRLAREGRKAPSPPRFAALRDRLGSAQPAGGRSAVSRRLLLAASVVLALGLGVLALAPVNWPGSSAELARVAEPELVTAGLPGLEAFLEVHGAEPVAPAELARRVSFRPTAPEALAGGYHLERAYLVRDRCCTGSCLIYRRGDELVTVIQQNPRHPVRWADAALEEGRFAGLACRKGRSDGVRVVQLEPAGRNLTIVAAEGVADLEGIVRDLAL